MIFASSSVGLRFRMARHSSSRATGVAFLPTLVLILVLRSLAPSAFLPGPLTAQAVQRRDLVALLPFTGLVVDGSVARAKSLNVRKLAADSDDKGYDYGALSGNLDKLMDKQYDKVKPVCLPQDPKQKGKKVICDRADRLEERKKQLAEEKKARIEAAKKAKQMANQE
mmetsp:Transcript_4975/g.9639  ORF Transcript_4975/g.9639 Transcript_4975/m.9639 type:complete len:168 (-) Transcript_4975:103-606(-)